MNYTRARRTLGALAAGAMLAAACGGDDDNGSASSTTVATLSPSTQVATTSPPASTTTMQPQTSPPTNGEATTTNDRPDDVDSLLTRGVQTEGKRVLPTQFDQPITLTLTGEWVASEVSAGTVILEDAERVAPFTRAVLILSSDPFAADTLDDWASGQEQVTVEDRRDTQVSGFDATVYDLTYGGETEVPVLTTTCQPCGGRIILRNTEYYRIWMVDIGADKPVAVFAPVLRDDVDWLDKADEVVDSFLIG